MEVNPEVEKNQTKPAMVHTNIPVERDPEASTGI